MSDEQIERDLTELAVRRVGSTLNDVCDLVSDPAVKARIALMASTVCIGRGAAYLSKAAERRGQELPEKAALLAVMDMIKLNTTDGADAVMRKMAGEHG